MIFVDFGTTLEDIQLLRNEMQAFVQDKDNSRDFQPDIEVEITGIAEMNKMELKVEIRHKSNWSNETVRAARRSKFMCALVLALRKIPIYAPGGGGAALGSVDQPSYTVSIPDTQAASTAMLSIRPKMPSDCFLLRSQISERIAQQGVPRQAMTLPKTTTVATMTVPLYHLSATASHPHLRAPHSTL